MFSIRSREGEEEGKTEKQDLQQERRRGPSTALRQKLAKMNRVLVSCSRGFGESFSRSCQQSFCLPWAERQLRVFNVASLAKQKLGHSVGF